MQKAAACFEITPLQAGVCAGVCQPSRKLACVGAACGAYGLASVGMFFVLLVFIYCDFSNAVVL